MPKNSLEIIKIGVGTVKFLSSISIKMKREGKMNNIAATVGLPVISKKVEGSLIVIAASPETTINTTDPK
jgi:hypothetical protein